MWHQWFNRNLMKLREYFLCTKNQNNDFIQQFLYSSLPSQSSACWQEYHDNAQHIQFLRQNTGSCTSGITRRSRHSDVEPGCGSVVKRPDTSVPSRYKKNENVTVPGFSSTGGTEYPINPVLDLYSPMISVMQKTKTWTESRNPVITELTV